MHAPAVSLDSVRNVAVAPARPIVFYFCRLGDMIMLTSLLSRLHRRYHLPCHVVGAGSWTASVYKGNPDVADVWSFGRHFPFPFSTAWPRTLRVLRESHPGPVYVCESHYRQLPRIRRMLFLARIDPSRCVFISDDPSQAPEHLVDRLSRFAERTPDGLSAEDFPIATNSPAPGPRLYVLDCERAERDAWLQSQGWLDRQRIIVQPGNHRSMGARRSRWRRLGTDDKAWPMDRWVRLLQRVHEERPEALILLRGAQAEVPMLHEIRAASGLSAVAVVGNGLRQLFALCESAHSIISVDTGPAHAAAALSVPLVVLFGAESQLYWLPRSPSASPVVGVGGPPYSNRADQVPVDAVFEAWRCLVKL